MFKLMDVENKDIFMLKLFVYLHVWSCLVNNYHNHSSLLDALALFLPAHEVFLCPGHTFTDWTPD